MLGALLAICSAATFAFNNASVRRGVLTGTVGQAMAITVPLGLPIFFLVAVVSGSLGTLAGFSPKSLAALSAAGILHFVWGRYCNYRATRAIGTNLVAPIQQVNLIFTLFLAIWLLGEQLTPLKILGIALVLIGPSVTMRSRRPTVEKEVSDEKITAIDAEKPVEFAPNYPEGIFFALLSATGYGFSPILVRVGLEGRGLAASVAGGLVAYIASTVVMGLVLLWPGRLRDLWAMKWESAKWFTLSGILVCLSQMFLYCRDVDRAGDGDLADQSAVDPVSALLQPAAQPRARNVWRRRHRRHIGVADGRAGVGAFGRRARKPFAASRCVLALLHWHWP